MYKYTTLAMFSNMIGRAYYSNNVDSYEYCEICNQAIGCGFEVVAILQDGIVYKMI